MAPDTGPRSVLSRSTTRRFDIAADRARCGLQPSRERTRNGHQPLTHQIHFAYELGDPGGGSGPSGSPGHDAFLDQPQVVAQGLERVGVHQRGRRAKFAQGFPRHQAARHEIPLSTVETYNGCRGARVLVSIQL